MPGEERSFRFGEFELDEARFELRRGGRPVALEPTPFRLLQHLLRERERVVAKEELLEAVWPGVAVGESVLSTALKEVRRALGDDGKEQRWIQTLRGRGVRFLGEVAAAASPRPAADAPPRPSRRPEASVTTIVFADLVASTERVQRLGDERAQRLFEALHQRMARVIEAPVYWSVSTMLNDTNRLGVFFPDGGNAGSNVIGTGAGIVPEPATAVLLWMGFVALGALRPRRTGA
jgi:DNA-binding winged helix-turn-helix (wHTH) protein